MHIDTNGHRMYYEVHGSGEPMLCMGGWGTFCHGKLRDLPRSATQGFQVIVFDYRGLGESTDDRSQPPTTKLYASDVAGLLDHLGVGPVHVLGMVGMGACIGQELAIARPDLVRSLVMTGTWAVADPMFTDQIEGLRRAHLGAGFEAFQLLTASFSFTPAFYNANRDRILGPSGAWGDLAGREEAHSRLIDACLGHDTTGRLDGIGCPTLVVHAGQDWITPARLTVPLEEGIPGAQGVHWEEIAHVIAGKEQKARFDEILTGFYSGL